MYMFDKKLGEMDVEIIIPEGDPRQAYISAGYIVETFRELTEDELDYLNEKYYEDIVTQALAINTLEDMASIKFYH